ncbi:hypothetical protein C1E23_21215, partial [Pseudoalteromonas phenolica]
MGTIWYLIFVTSLYHYYFNEYTGVNLPIIITTSVIFILLILIIITALPFMRAKFHNQFEITHRLGGWTVLILFWVQMFLFLEEQ